jgi:hypothetical protein
MKTLLMVAVVVGALGFAATDNKADAGNSDSEWESRVAQVDGYLSEGLTGETHKKIAGPARDGADAVVDFSDGLTTFVE